ncbi:LPS assembly protein LptD [Sphingomonas sp. BGYR3]|uniref:LPS-assembly protein LptD n=1 Tax=Sphingomonas sp. BGYR3 TaxID=2975483 RepID=UPI0021A28E58|nr:LPS assembly protein LptD [Sphingomonas sp. BGYR3]
MTRTLFLLSCALTGCVAAPAWAQDLSERPVDPPPPSAEGTPPIEEQVQFESDQLEYDTDTEIVSAAGDVRLFREGSRLRADKVTWNRNTGIVVAEGNVAIVSPEGDTAYGDRIELTDSLKDGVVDNILVVLEQGGRLAAERGERLENGGIIVDRAAYTPCSVTDSKGCPKEPSWKITAVRVVYDPVRERIRYSGARLAIFGIASLPLPEFSHPAGESSDRGILSPLVRLDRVNGLELAVPYYWNLAPNRDLTITPHLFTSTLPMIEGEYRALTATGSYRVRAFGTYSRVQDDLASTATDPGSSELRGYLEGNARFQLNPNWSFTGAIRLASDQTFLRRYDISRDDRLRNVVRVERMDETSYFSISGWAVQTLRITENQRVQPIALPEIDFRKRLGDGVVGGMFEFQLNTLALSREEGQDTQRAFASARWDLRRLTPWGHEVTLTAYARGDAYNTRDTLSTLVPSYRGEEGFRTRGVAAAAVDVKWPFIGGFLGGTQRITPRFQVVAAPPIDNFDVPNEDARAVDLEDSNLFALNRFPGYDRFEDSTRFTAGVEYALDLPGVAINTTVGQSFRLTSRSSILPDGTGLSEKVSDIVGRTDVRFRDFLRFTHRYRLDKDNFAVRRNEIDATIGTRRTYAQLGYLRLNRDVSFDLADLQDREEARVGGRVAISRFWSVFGSALVDLTDQREDLLSTSDGFSPIRHRVGVAYDDDCLRLGVTWRRDYQDNGDARRGNSFLLTLELLNLGR